MPNTAYMLVTNRCNMRCKYCYEREFFKDHYKDMDLETMNKTVDFLAHHAKPNNFTQGKNHCSIFYFGGEPTLNWKIVKENMRYAKGYRDKGINFGLFFLTNGYILPAPQEQFFHTLKEYDVAVQVSLDGCKKAHNSARGHFEDIIKNIQKIQIGLSRHIMVRMTVTPENLAYAYESFVQLNKMSCKVAMTLALESDWTDDHVALARTEFRKIMNYYKKAMIRTPIKFNIAEKIVKGGFTSCHAGGSMVGVDVDGNIYPCHRFVFHKDAKENWLMGNVKTEGVKKYPNFNKIFETCESCECTICHPCPSSIIAFDVKLPSMYCKVYKAIQEECTPIARDIHNHNFEQVMIKFMKLGIGENLCKKS